MNTQDKSVSNATPGPWSVHVRPMILNAFEVVSEDHQIRIARAYNEADAYLIAAAPELRDALYTITEYMRDTPAASKVDTKAYALLQQGRAALAKALPPVSEGGEGA